MYEDHQGQNAQHFSSQWYNPAGMEILFVFHASVAVYEDDKLFHHCDKRKALCSGIEIAGCIVRDVYCICIGQALL